MVMLFISRVYMEVFSKGKPKLLIASITIEQKY